MSTSSVYKRCAFGIAVITFSGCGGSRSQLVMPNAVPQGSSVATNAAHGRPWMLPEAKSDNLLYVSSDNQLYLFSYPGSKLVGTFESDGAAGMCPDKVGDVWVTTFQKHTIVKYAHGGTTPIATLDVPNQFAPQGCAIDPNSGDLAVVGYGSSNRLASVRVYANGTGKPTIYKVRLDTTSFAGYDNNGNLFVTGYGYNGNPTFGVVELEKGAQKFRNISFPPSSPFGGYEPEPVQWDGQYIAIGTAVSVVRYEIQNFTAVAKGETEFRDLHTLANAWIQDRKIVVVNIFGSGGYPPVQIDRYPAGGKPIKTPNGFSGNPFGVTVSLAPG